MCNAFVATLTNRWENLEFFDVLRRTNSAVGAKSRFWIVFCKLELIPLMNVMSQLVILNLVFGNGND